MRLIDADVITDHEIIDYLGISYASCLPDVRDLLDEQPTIEAVPVVHGEWLKVQEWVTKAKFRCSVCGREIMSATKVNPYKYPYCHCGAKMEGGAE